MRSIRTPFIPILVVAALLTGCATVGGKLTTADTKAVTTLLDVKAEKDARCDAGDFPASNCQALASAFIPVWDAYLAVNAAILAEDPVAAVDGLVQNFKKVAQDFKDEVNKLNSAKKQLLLDILEGILSRYDR